MTTLTISVPDISCGHCKSSIEGALQPLDGVTSAEVSIEARTVDIAFDGPTTLDEIVAAIEAQGYEVAS
jgi:copper chaperone